jgi:hypothetical protein
MQSSCFRTVALLRSVCDMCVLLASRCQTHSHSILVTSDAKGLFWPSFLRYIPMRTLRSLLVLTKDVTVGVTAVRDFKVTWQLQYLFWVTGQPSLGCCTPGIFKGRRLRLLR